jgi:hypothetical protein
VWNLLPLVGVQETLHAQVVVPLDGEAFVLFVQRGQRNVVTADKIAAPLLDTEVVIAEVLCETPDYVEWGERMQSKRGLSSFRLHIIRAMRGRSSGGRQAGSV